MFAYFHKSQKEVSGAVLVYAESNEFHDELADKQYREHVVRHTLLLLIITVCLLCQHRSWLFL